MFRKAEEKINDFFNSKQTKCLLVTGARQIGKTYILRKLGRQHFGSFVEINFLEQTDARDMVEQAADAKELLLKLSVLSLQELIPGDTLIFFDEVQECPALMTAIKFLVEEGSYRFVLSGSLLGVTLKDVRSMPVGYMDIIQMYPMDFEEFCIAVGVGRDTIAHVRDAFDKRVPVDELVHKKMMELFRLYLVVGGMPAVVARYNATNNIQDVVREQSAIVTMYKKDIAKYDPDEKLLLDDIFDLIPSELNNKNKRFVLKNLNENFKFSRYSNSFLWLKNAGVALPTYCVDEPRLPLMLSKSTNLFKLFLADVGLLAAMYMDGIQKQILLGEKDINFGAIYENVVAQELTAHGFPLYYFNNKKQGELDFVIEYQGAVLPIEVKSGKTYARHNAMSGVLANPLYDIPRGIVLCAGNVAVSDKTLYLPMYMTMFLEKETMEAFFYQVDIEGLA